MYPERLYLPAPWVRPGLDKWHPLTSASIVEACFNTRQALQNIGFMAVAAKEPKYPPRWHHAIRAKNPTRPRGRLKQLLYRTGNTIIPLKLPVLHGGDNASPGFTHHRHHCCTGAAAHPPSPKQTCAQVLLRTLWLGLPCLVSLLF